MTYALPITAGTTLTRSTPTPTILRHRVHKSHGPAGPLWAQPTPGMTDDPLESRSSTPPSKASVDIGRIRTALPFITDPEILAPAVQYEAMLQTTKGVAEYQKVMQAWSQLLPQRLQGLEVSDVQIFQLRPGQCRAKWTYKFTAILPPGARMRGLPEDMVVMPGEKVRVQTSITADLDLDDQGRIVRHSETITDGYDIPATISRYEYLTARRLDDPVPVWYWKVLEATTIEEAGVLADGQATPGELRQDFAMQVLRNLVVGMGLGYCIYYGTKILLYYLRTM